MGAASVSPATPSRLKTGYSDLFPEGHFPLCPITASVSAALFRSPGTSETLKFTLAPRGPYPSAFTEAPVQTEAELPLLWLPLRRVCTASHAEHLESTSVSLRAESAPLAVSLPQPWCPSSRQAKGEQSSLTVPGHLPPPRLSPTRSTLPLSSSQMTHPLTQAAVSRARACRKPSLDPPHAAARATPAL